MKTIKVTCPHCGHQVKTQVNANDVSDLHLLTCPSDEGGCDKDFAFKPKVTVEVTTYKLVETKGGAQ